MKETGLEKTKAYIILRQNTIAQYIATCPILDMCPAAERHPGARVPKWWWEQGGLYREGAQEETEEVEEGREEKPHYDNGER